MPRLGRLGVDRMMILRTHLRRAPPILSRSACIDETLGCQAVYWRQGKGGKRLVIRRQVVGVVLCVCVCELELVQSSSGISPPVRARGARALKCGRAGLKNNLTIKTSCPAQLGMAPPLVVSIARARKEGHRVGLRAAAPALTLAAA